MASRFETFEHLFTHNWYLKLLAIFVAAATYYAIREMTRYEVDHDVPVEVKVSGGGIAILDQDPMTVRIFFRGSQEDLWRLDQKQLRVTVDARADSPDGSETVAIGPRNVEGASGVSVVRIEPAFVHMTFDRQIEKVVQVAKPTTTGTPLIGQVNVEYEPDTVIVRGPRRALADVRIAKTEPIDVEGRGASFTRRVRVVLPGDTGVSQIEPPDVKVKVNIVTETVTRGWTNLAVMAVVRRGLSCDVDYQPRTVNVYLHGRAEVLDKIPDSSVKVFVDCSSLQEPGSRPLPVLVNLPPGLDVNATIEPKTVMVTFRNGPSAAPPTNGTARTVASRAGLVPAATNAPSRAATSEP